MDLDLGTLLDDLIAARPSGEDAQLPPEAVEALGGDHGSIEPNQCVLRALTAAFLGPQEAGPTPSGLGPWHLVPGRALRARSQPSVAKCWSAWISFYR